MQLRIGLVTAIASVVLGAFTSCTCQRQENIEAKERLSKPAPPDPHVKAADDKIDVEKLDDPDVMRRVTSMGADTVIVIVE